MHHPVRAHDVPGDNLDILHVQLVVGVPGQAQQLADQVEALGELWNRRRTDHVVNDVVFHGTCNAELQLYKQQQSLSLGWSCSTSSNSSDMIVF